MKESRYDPLRHHLAARREAEVTLSFDEIERLVGPLPRSAQVYDAWWANEDPDRTTHSQCRAWRLADFLASPHLPCRRVTFRRNDRNRSVTPPQEMERER